MMESKSVSKHFIPVFFHSWMIYYEKPVMCCLPLRCSSTSQKMPTNKMKVQWRRLRVISRISKILWFTICFAIWTRSTVKGKNWLCERYLHCRLHTGFHFFHSRNSLTSPVLLTFLSDFFLGLQNLNHKILTNELDEAKPTRRWLNCVEMSLLSPKFTDERHFFSIWKQLSNKYSFRNNCFCANILEFLKNFKITFGLIFPDFSLTHSKFPDRKNIFSAVAADPRYYFVNFSDESPWRWEIMFPEVRASSALLKSPPRFWNFADKFKQCPKTVGKIGHQTLICKQ